MAAVNKAKAANMPKDKIEAAIKRGVEGKDGKRQDAGGRFGSAMTWLMETTWVRWFLGVQAATLRLCCTRLRAPLEAR